MNDFLIKSFIKDYNNTQDFTVRENYGKFSGIIGIFCNILLSVSKILVGLLFKSVAVVADGVNNLSDASNSVITLIGFKIASKPADKEHPFGHARFEYVSGLMVSFLIMLLGLSLLKSSFLKIFTPEPVTFSILTVAILIFSILIKFWMYGFNKKIAKKISSVTVLATAKDSLNDVISTSAVLLSIIVSRLFSIEIDGFVGTLVSLFVIYSGFELINDTLSPLLGEAPKEDLVRLMETEIPKYPSVIGIHDLVIHNYGESKCFATVHVEVPANQDITVSHDIIDNIENDFYTKHKIQLVIHLDPVETENEDVTTLKNTIKEKINEFSCELSIHDFRVVFGDTHNNVIFDVVVPIDFSMNDKEVKEKICEIVKSTDEKNIAVIKIDKKYYDL